MKMKTWIEEQSETDACLVCDADLEDRVDVSDGVCAVCLVTQ